MTPRAVTACGVSSARSRGSPSLTVECPARSDLPPIAPGLPPALSTGSFEHTIADLNQQGHQGLADYARSAGNENDGHARQSSKAAPADKKVETPSPR